VTPEATGASGAGPGLVCWLGACPGRFVPAPDQKTSLSWW
jgi:hypothetical protein